MIVVTWNPEDKASNISLSNNNLTVDILAQTRGVRATEGKNSGKWYWEILHEVTANNNLFVGVSTQNYSLSDSALSFDNNLLIAYSGQLRPANDVYGMMLDMDKSNLTVYRNNELFSTLSFTPEIIGLEVYAHIGMYTRQNTNKATVNFGAIPFVYPVPEGCLPYDSVNATWFLYKKLLLKSNNKIYSLKSTKKILHETKMTSNTAPVPYVASASGVNSSYPAWRAFNGTVVDANDGWVSDKNTGWIQIDFGSLKRVSYVEISMRNTTTLDSAPKDFEILASNDNINFELIGTVTGESNWKSSEKRIFLLDYGEYKQLRINVIRNNGHASQLTIGDILFGYTESFTQLPSDSLENFINYGSSSIDNFDLINTNKNYILSTDVSENADGLWVQEIDRKPLSIKFE